MKRGFTLLEVILALGLVPILALSLFFLFSRSLRLRRQADDVTRGTEVARLEMEAIRRLQFNQIPAAITCDGALATPPSGGFPPAPYPQLLQDGQLYTLRVDTASENGCRAVRVQVSWPGAHSLFVETLINP